uniref:transposase n=1 Tax=Microbacterium betulae TaxID=2981139 RepID=UPI003743260A
MPAGSEVVPGLDLDGQVVGNSHRRASLVDALWLSDDLQLVEVPLDTTMVAGPMVASIIRTVFVPRGKASLVTAQFGEVVRMLERSHPPVAEMLEDARDELLAFTAFPAAHWQQIWSTNPLERLNKEIKRRTDVVGAFPNPAALLRLAGHVLIEQHDEWDSADRCYFSDASMALPNTTDEEGSIPELTAA